MRYTHILTAVMVFSANAVFAENSPIEQSMEPEVVITSKDQGRVKEYRVNGQLYMIEIVPKKGVPYYLIDSDGDGLLESRHDGSGSDLPIPRWPVLRW